MLQASTGLEMEEKIAALSTIGTLLYCAVKSVDGVFLPNPPQVTGHSTGPPQIRTLYTRAWRPQSMV